MSGGAYGGRDASPAYGGGRGGGVAYGGGGSRSPPDGGGSSRSPPDSGGGSEIAAATETRPPPMHSSARAAATPSLQRRSTTALGSSLPTPVFRRTASETRARAGAAGDAGGTGPLGAYRSLSRSTAGRTATPTRRALGGDVPEAGDVLDTAAPAAAGSPHKRTFSVAGLQGDQLASLLATPQRTAKRPLVSSALATAPRPRRAGEAPGPSPCDSYELQMLRSEYERRLQTEQHAYRTLEAALRTQSREMEALKCQRVEVLQEWEAERAAQQERQASWDTAKAALEEQVAAMRIDARRLLADKDALAADRDARRREAQDASNAQQVQQVQLQARLDDAQAQCEHLQWTNAALRERAEGAAAAPAGAPAGVAADEVTHLKEQLQQQLAAVRRLEVRETRLCAENARLSEARESVTLLREANRALEGRVQRMDTLQERLLHQDDALAATQAAQAEWAALMRTGIATDEHAAFVAAANVGAAVPAVAVPDELTPATLPAYVSALRGTIMGLAARNEGLVHSVAELRSSNVDLGRRARQGSENEASLSQALSESAIALQRAQRTGEVQRDELRRLRELLVSFEAEARGAGGPHPSFEQTQAKRAADLEVRSAELAQENASLADRLLVAEHAAATAQAAAAAPRAPADVAPALAAARAELEEARAQSAALDAQLTALGAENESLWTRVGRGEFDAAREQCLVLKDNPVARDQAVRTAALDALRRENEALLGKVQELAGDGGRGNEGGGGGAEGPPPHGGDGDALHSDAALVPLQTVENLRAEIARAHDAMQLKDKGMLRLKQVFTAKANEFREAVQSLFGYKLRFLENGKVKLTSAYARGARVTTLVFRSDEGNIGQMKLQGEAMDGLANVAHLREYWLSDGVRHSVPCFLAALNLELYENTTQALRGDFVGEG
ncbi:[phosphatase 2A protein]-leucine-carboxy methyltransferase [Malassezia sp. CBS 17886]|nr:[phosphatase 2A protein]-leucine-carboxy methyltransferase [Malassezia sp. CBS 17886]